MTFASAPLASYDSILSFYEAAVYALWRGSDSEEKARLHIESATPRPSTTTVLNQLYIEVCLKTVPRARSPNMSEAVDVMHFRNEWNNIEFAWVTASEYWMLDWGTST